MIADVQVLHFNTFGFVVQREVLTLQEVEGVSRDFERGLDEFKRSRRGGGPAFNSTGRIRGPICRS
jgi:hypothetical protein